MTSIRIFKTTETPTIVDVSNAIEKIEALTEPQITKSVFLDLLTGFKSLIKALQLTDAAAYAVFLKWLKLYLHIANALDPTDNQLRAQFEKYVPAAISYIAAALNQKPENLPCYHYELLELTLELLENVSVDTLQKVANLTEGLIGCFWLPINFVGDFNTQKLALRLLTKLMKCLDAEKQRQELARIVSEPCSPLQADLCSAIRVADYHAGIFENTARNILNDYNMKLSKNVRVYSMRCKSVVLAKDAVFHKALNADHLWIDLNYCPRTITFNARYRPDYKEKFIDIGVCLQVRKLSLCERTLSVHLKAPPQFTVQIRYQNFLRSTRIVTMELLQADATRLMANKCVLDYYTQSVGEDAKLTKNSTKKNNSKENIRILKENSINKAINARLQTAKLSNKNSTSFPHSYDLLIGNSAERHRDKQPNTTDENIFKKPKRILKTRQNENIEGKTVPAIEKSINSSKSLVEETPKTSRNSAQESTTTDANKLHPIAELNVSKTAKRRFFSKKLVVEVINTKMAKKPKIRKIAEHKYAKLVKTPPKVKEINAVKPMNHLPIDVDTDDLAILSQNYQTVANTNQNHQIPTMYIPGTQRRLEDKTENSRSFHALNKSADTNIIGNHNISDADFSQTQRNFQSSAQNLTRTAARSTTMDDFEGNDCEASTSRAAQNIEPKKGAGRKRNASKSTEEETNEKNQTKKRRSIRKTRNTRTTITIDSDDDFIPHKKPRKRNTTTRNTNVKSIKAKQVNSARTTTNSSTKSTTHILSTSSSDVEEQQATISNAKNPVKTLKDIEACRQIALSMDISAFDEFMLPTYGERRRTTIYKSNSAVDMNISNIYDLTENELSSANKDATNLDVVEIVANNSETLDQLRTSRKSFLVDEGNKFFLERSSMVFMNISNIADANEAEVINDKTKSDNTNLNIVEIEEHNNVVITAKSNTLMEAEIEKSQGVGTLEATNENSHDTTHGSHFNFVTMEANNRDLMSNILAKTNSVLVEEKTNSSVNKNSSESVNMLTKKNAVLNADKTNSSVNKNSHNVECVPYSKRSDNAIEKAQGSQLNITGIEATNYDLMENTLTKKTSILDSEKTNTESYNVECVIYSQRSNAESGGETEKTQRSQLNEENNNDLMLSEKNSVLDAEKTNTSVNKNSTQPKNIECVPYSKRSNADLEKEMTTAERQASAAKEKLIEVVTKSKPLTAIKPHFLSQPTLQNCQLRTSITTHQLISQDLIFEPTSSASVINATEMSRQTYKETTFKERAARLLLKKATNKNETTAITPYLSNNQKAMYNPVCHDLAKILQNFKNTMHREFENIQQPTATLDTLQQRLFEISERLLVEAAKERFEMQESQQVLQRITSQLNWHWQCYQRNTQRFNCFKNSIELFIAALGDIDLNDDIDEEYKQLQYQMRQRGQAQSKEQWQHYIKNITENLVQEMNNLSTL